MFKVRFIALCISIITGIPLAILSAFILLKADVIQGWSLADWEGWVTAVSFSAGINLAPEIIAFLSWVREAYGKVPDSVRKAGRMATRSMPEQRNVSHVPPGELPKQI